MEGFQINRFHQFIRVWVSNVLKKNVRSCDSSRGRGVEKNEKEKNAINSFWPTACYCCCRQTRSEAKTVY